MEHNQLAPQQTTETQAEELLRLVNLSIFSENQGSKAKQALIENWSFRIKTGDVIAIIGRNGSGKTSLVKTIAGMLKNYTGEIQKSPSAKISYMPQTTEISKSIPITVKGFISLRATEENHQTMKLLGITPLLNQQIASLSGGEMQKVLFYSTIQSGANLILLDEPENHLDESSVEIIMQIISNSKNKAFMVISHEYQKIIEQSNHILQIGSSILCKQHPNCIN